MRGFTSFASAWVAFVANQPDPLINWFWPKTQVLTQVSAMAEKKGFLYSQVNHPLSALYMNRDEEIREEGRKWLLKHVSNQAQTGLCGSGCGTLLPSFWFQRALGMRCVYFPQLALFTSNRTQLQHSLLIDTEGCSTESGLSARWLPSISF